MARQVSSATWERLARLRRQRRFQNIATLGLAVLAPVLAGLTLAVLGPLDRNNSGGAWLRLILLADLLYLITLLGLVGFRLVRMITERRQSRAGSRLHLRLVSIFTGIALVPTVLVALFAGLTVNIGLEGWFSSRVQSVVASALSAAEAYQAEHRADLTEDAEALARFLDRAAAENRLIDDGALRQLLGQGQTQIQRGLREGYIIDGAGRIRARGERSYRFWYEQPTSEQIAIARRDGIALIEDWPENEFRALVPLTTLGDRLLYVTRDVNGELLGLLDRTRETGTFYQQLERTRGRVLFEFSLVYLGFALLLVAAAIWLGLWFAERLSQPIGRIASAAEAVGKGELGLQIPEPDTGDEIQTLGQAFNRMTRQLKTQREELVASYEASDAQRRLFDSVLSSVTAGVIGLDAAGEIDFVNRSATRLLGLDAASHDVPLSAAVPEFAALFARLNPSVADSLQDEVRLTRHGRMESLLVRVAVRRGAEGAPEGYVVAFDDVTELVSAQRMAAWGDVARRVAHEIKNPLTPIQLSAERVKRKFMKFADNDADREALTQYTDVIIRQTGDLRRIVDEFSRFARMPEPERREMDLAKLVRDSLVLQQDAMGGTLVADVPAEPVLIQADAGMIGQALTNLLKNAGEAVAEISDNPPEGWTPQVNVSLTSTPEVAVVRISDNGTGLPEDRSRLFEPYVTLKSGGTGLGLPIVKKIIEEHGGTLTLEDNHPRGAVAEIRLPRQRVQLGNPAASQAPRPRRLEQETAGTS
ncbi:PAS domain-containing sensor histidine kinase [Paracoccus suum]|uniref:histidine kinase n=1 Tax=Paracoccus suum TaxID=2259340 RepID=A0A344PNA0_9RHOB|nr:PAS domain-containing sensor histidine kinase [Paracoccus suum]AXC50855.1 PAS domain-containing sensor histidine kinase [Paracoccus suum]